MFSINFNQAIKLSILLLGLWWAFDFIAYLAVERLWFEEVGYLQVFGLQVKTRGWLWLIGFLGTAGFLLSNLRLAKRLKYHQPVAPENNSAQGSGLLPAVLLLSLLIGLLLIHYGQVALQFWHPTVSVVSLSTQSLNQLKLQILWQILLDWLTQPWQLGLAFGFMVALVIYPQPLLNVIAVGLSLIFGFVLSGHWTTVVQYFNATPFATSDPVFGQDISFYIFALPLWELLRFWSLGLFSLGLLAVALIYLLSGNSLAEGRFHEFSQAQQRHLSGLAGCWCSAIAVSYWLSRYELLYSPTGVVYGASYTDVTARLPACTALSLLGGAIAIFLLWRAIFWSKATGKRRSRLILILGLYLGSAIVALVILPLGVQRLGVQPNELIRERPYIQRSIELTRQAFDLAAINVETFNPQGNLTYADIQANDLTVQNIRLWDTRPLLETNRQLQRIRPYYEFPDADVDRYTLKTLDRSPERQSDKRQVFISARELQYSAVPEQAQTWVNQHWIYTHGYGFTVSPVNTAGPSGLPEFFVRDIGVGTDEGNLRVTNQNIEASLPIGRPRIYYGELTHNYVMTSAKVKELDYPSGAENVYNTYDGRGGVPISSLWRRGLFAKYLKDWQMLFSQNFTPETKLLFRRQIRQRIQAIAPFLQYDGDPYLVVADVNPGNRTDQNYLYWMIDAYTTSDRYPYADPGDNQFNYIRNSVKVVVDAYHGSVDFYVIDPEDPIIKTWQAIFPNLFKPFSQLPAALRSHIRYPMDLFKVQSERLLTYHMTDPQVFYNREDLWRDPNEIYGGKPQLVEPYYLITNLPTTEDAEEFVLLYPFTPARRNNLIAWLAARSDGDNYGKRLLYQFPKQELVYGPEQIEARINQDPIISQQISLWNRQGSRAVQGNLLVIPIEQSLLYVEPLYLEAARDSLPTLVRVIVAYENRIVMAETLDQALRGIFQDSESSPAIIRPLAPGVPAPQ